MADLADMLVGSALETSKSVPDISGSIQKGAELGAHIANIQAQRAQIEQQKQELQMHKINSVMDTFKIASEAKDPKLKNFLLKNVAPSKIKALGLEEFFNPQAFEMISTSDAALQKVIGLQLDLVDKVQRGQMSSAEAYSYAQSVLSNPEELAMLDTDRLFEAQKFQTDESNTTARSKYTADATAQRAQDARDEAGDVEYRKKIASIGMKYNGEGGAANAAKAISNLRLAIRDLKPGPNGQPPKYDFGTLGKALFGDKKAYLRLTDPGAKAIVDRVRGAVKLKELLNDSNPTESQITEILGQLIDVGLPNEYNIEKLTTFLNETEMKNNAIIGELKRYNLYRGEPKGITSSADKGKKEVDAANNTPKKRFSDYSAMQQDLIVNGIAKKTGRDPAEIRAELEAQ